MRNSYIFKSKKNFILRNKLLWLFCLTTLTAHAQVGINIQSPYSNSVLHIKGDPSKTTIIGDEMIISTEGNIGIGTFPTTKLSIVKNGTNSPLRIVDGKVKANQIMTSDANGYIGWKDMPTTGSQNYSLVGGTLITYPTGAYTFVTKINISDKGLYSLALRWWGMTDSFNGNHSSAAIFYLTVSKSTNNAWAANQNDVKDSSEEYVFGKAGSTSSPDKTFCFTKSFTAEAEAGTYMRLYIRVTNGGPWTIRTTSDPWNGTWVPSIILFRI